MLIHKILILNYLSLFFIGCATTYAPPDWLPETEDVAKNTFGGWLTVVTFPDTSGPEERWFQYGGEFISHNSGYVYLLYDTIYVVPKNNVQKVILELDEKNSFSYGLWTLGGTVSTISNGFYLIFTAPFWLVTGIPATISESGRDTYSSDSPDSVYWTDIQKFARFPQGLPENIDLKNLKPRVNFNK